MKKLVAMMIGLGLMLGTVSMFAAEEKPEQTEQKGKKGKKGKKGQKKEEEKKPAAR